MEQDPRSNNQNRDLVPKVLSGDTRAIARLLTIVESSPGEAVPYLRELFAHTGRCFTLGVTGAPGAGKSTFVDKLAESYRSAGKKVGIIAVDPTSPFTGGAILGDRIRMQSLSLDSGTFIRSMAARGHIGGLSRAAVDGAAVLDAAGFDIVILETVGVGQGEVEVAKTAEATVVLLVPGMGDDIQAMKAGIMEIADIFVINKADHPGVERVETELRSFVSMAVRNDSWTPAIVQTVASEGKGIQDCMRAVEEYRTFLAESQSAIHRRIQVQKERLLELVCVRIREDLLNDPETSARIDELASLIAERKLDPYTGAEEAIRLLSAAEKPARVSADLQKPS